MQKSANGKSLPYPRIKLLIIMKLTAILLCVTLLKVSAEEAKAQSITLNFRNTPIEKVFSEIERQSGYSFLYGKKVISTAAPVSISIDNASLETVLKAVFMNQPLAFKIADRQIIVSAKVVNIEPVKAPEAAPGILVHGRVTDKEGYPMPSVSVVIPGTPLGTMTNAKGEYTIREAPENADLVFSYVGFAELRVHINGRQELNAVLLPIQNRLDEMVIIAYGKTTKRLNTGSVVTINSDVIEKQPVQNVMDALPGRVAGVQITQNNGLPGSNTQMQIRGQGSLNSGTIPLYVIDGVPYTNFNGGQPPQDNLDAWGISGANGGTSPFSSINPSDIQSITILKDADATAIYGARGANGVVLITTKRGGAGVSRVNIYAYSGVGKVGHWIPMLNTQQYLALRREAFRNDGVNPATAPARPYDLLDWDQNAYTDWQKYLLGGAAHSSNAEVAYSGGSENTFYRLSGAFRHDGTIYIGDWRTNRATTRFSLDHHSVNSRFGFSFSASYAYENTKLPHADPSVGYVLPPNYPSKLKDSTGKLSWYPGFTNPLSYLQQPYYGVTTNVMGNFSMHYMVLPGLDLKLSSGYTNILLDSRYAAPASSLNPSYNPVSSAYFSTDKAQNWIVEPTAAYNLQMGQGRLSALAGGTFQQNISQTVSTKGTNYSSDQLLGSLVGAGLVTSYFPNYAQYNFTSVYGRINYSWANKYILNATFRRDGSSRFGANNRFGNFWAVGGAWVFSEESFIKNHLSWLSFGKLRGSYGLTGNDQIPDYIYLSLYSVLRNPYLNQAGLYQGTTPNPDIQWETARKLEFGMELGFLKDKITLTANYYRNRSGNQLTYMSLPTQTGFSSYEANMPAVIQNTGLELLVETKNIVRKNFQWTTSFNVTFPSNKLVSYPNLAQSFYSNTYVVGQPVTLTKLFHYLGVDPSTGEPKFATKSGSGVPDYNADRVVAPIGTPYFGGISNDFTYHRWTLGFFIQWYHQKGYTNASYGSAIGSTMANQNTSVLDRWQQSGDVSKLFPGASATPGSPIYNAYGYYYGSSDAFWGDASWLKLQNASLSYSFEEKQVKRMGLSGLRVFAQGQNLLLFDKNKYQLDPTTTIPGGPSGLGTGRYPAVPPLRTIVAGVNVSF